MLPRLLSAVTLACLPLAKGLDETQLLSTVTCVILFLVIWESLGSLERGVHMIESWKDDPSETSPRDTMDEEALPTDKAG